MDIEIRILNAKDVNDFRKIRLEALLHSPKMFGSSYEIEREKPLTYFEGCLSYARVFGVYQDTEIIALATLSKEAVVKLAHKAYLSSVFVKDQYQNQGIAQQLLKAIIEDSKAHVEQILLTVAEDNQQAIHLYKKLGFQIYGTEQKALKDAEEYYDELLMKLFL